MSGLITSGLMGLNFRLKYIFTFFKFDFRRGNDRLVIDILTKIEVFPSSTPFILLKRFYITTRLILSSLIPNWVTVRTICSTAKVGKLEALTNLRVRVGNLGRGMN